MSNNLLAYLTTLEKIHFLGFLGEAGFDTELVKEIIKVGEKSDNELAKAMLIAVQEQIAERAKPAQESISEILSNLPPSSQLGTGWPQMADYEEVDEIAEYDRHHRH
jgi:hypothetical protein